MKEIDINQELKDALNRSNWTQTLLATSLHVTKGAVTNWTLRDNIPDKMLLGSMRLLNDYRFSLAVAEYLTGVKTYSIKRVEDTPYARFFSQAKEEHDRQDLDHDFTLLMGKRKEDRTQDDRKKIVHYAKELSEEIEEENSLLAAVMEDWDLII
ncbi:hypothetical protein ACFQ4L_10540 [Lapidilactobacillus mulanensis]|uniref:XRE family transcriptional regulator n=1 Tax=Lapidilactobacillus mulanensis TaxID=2485999 RepID=A0ABW4DQY4_9LACO|nr:hypothetical protein [Lapidilactobacillus mulanensis]